MASLQMITLRPHTDLKGTVQPPFAFTALASLILDGLVSTFLVFLDLVFHFNLKLTHHVDPIFI